MMRNVFFWEKQWNDKRNCEFLEYFCYIYILIFFLLLFFWMMYLNIDSNLNKTENKKVNENNVLI